MEAFSKENRGFQELNTMMRTGSRARVRRPRVQAGGAMVVHLWNSVVMAPTPQLPVVRQGRAACGPGVGEVGLPREDWSRFQVWIRGPDPSLQGGVGAGL